MKELFFGLISGTRGKGPSSTRLIYLINGVAAVFCAIVATMGGTIVYCARSEADAGVLDRRSGIMDSDSGLRR